MLDALKVLCKGEANVDACTLKGFYEALHALDITASAVLIFAGTLTIAAAHTIHSNRPAEVRAYEEDAARKKAAAEEADASRKFAAWVLLLSLVAAGLCLRVAQISYPFHGYVHIDVPKATADFSEEFKQLEYEVWLRTWLFWLATLLSAVAVVIAVWRTLYEYLHPKWAAWLFFPLSVIGGGYWIYETARRIHDLWR